MKSLQIYLLSSLISSWTFTLAVVITEPCCTPLMHTVANFGPQDSDYNIKANLMRSVPADGCEVTDLNFDGNIALVERGTCRFADKVLNMQKQNASAVIVFNTPPAEGAEDLLVTMASSDEDETPKLIDILSVFVNHESGVILNSTDMPTVVLNSTGQLTAVYYNPDFASAFWSILVFFFQVFLLLWTIVICIFGASYGMHKYKLSWRRRAIQRLPKRNYDSVAESAFHSTSCVICIDDFEVGDVLKTLPCNHEFHAECIDPWLHTKSSLCPICKRSIIHNPSATTVTEGGDTASSNLLESAGASNRGANDPGIFANGFLPVATMSTLRILRFCGLLLVFAFVNFIFFYIFALIGRMFGGGGD